jgi:protein-disulfide isomerase
MTTRRRIGATVPHHGLSRCIAAVAAVAMFGPLATSTAQAQHSRAEIEAIVKEYLAKNPGEVERIVKGYLAKNPELVQEALTELLKRRAQAQVAAAADPAPAIKSNAKLLFDSPRQVTLGNPRGDVTLVEFLDYNCGFCKRALPDMLALLAEDKDLKIVIKEWPVLGPGSNEAARVAVAVRMQDPSGAKYLAFHRILMGERGQANKQRAIAAAGESGLDIARIEKDLASAEVGQTLEESVRLAGALGLRGTPAYVIGDAIIPGAVGLTVLKDRIAAARKRP